MKEIIGEYAFVAKVNVSDLDLAVAWYERIGLVLNPDFQTPTWRQMIDPNDPNVNIGLNLDAQNTGTAGAVSTFVVVDIVAARDALIAVGVNVGPISVYPPVHMCFFNDPDGNMLGLRQN